MKRTEHGHSISFIAQNWDAYPDFIHRHLYDIGDYRSSLDNDPKDDGKQHMDMNTWYSWHLIPTSRPTLPHPTQKTSTIDIPGTNGIVDLTYSMVKYPIFGNREGSFEFHVDPDFRPWNVLYTEISSFIHGQRLRMVLEDDPEYYWAGRFWVDGWTSNSDGSGSTITIGYSVEPYKVAILSSVDDWLWDPFNFYTGVITNSNSGPFVVDASENFPSGISKYQYMNNLDKSAITDISGEHTSETSNMWSNRIDLYRLSGAKPQIPIIRWRPSDYFNNPSGQKTSLLVNYCNNSLDIRYGRVNPHYKWFDPTGSYGEGASISSSGVRFLGLITKDRLGNDLEVSERYYAFQDDDMIFCDRHHRQYNFIQFIGNGTVKIDFHRGEL